MGLFKNDDNRQRFIMREKLFSIGDDSWIETENGERAFKVDGKALRVRDTSSAQAETTSASEASRLRAPGVRPTPGRVASTNAPAASAAT